MEYIKTNRGIEIKIGKCFDLKNTFECGQCFRWNENADGSYSGIVGNKYTEIFRDGEFIVIAKCIVMLPGRKGPARILLFRTLRIPKSKENLSLANKIDGLLVYPRLSPRRPSGRAGRRDFLYYLFVM